MNYDNGNVNEELMFRDKEVKEAHFNFWTVVFPLFFAIPFAGAGFGIPILAYLGKSEVQSMVGPSYYFMFIPFALVGFATLLIPLIVVYRRLLLNMFGEYIYGVVEGYVNDTFIFNGRPGQVARIRVDTETGPAIIRYQLGTIDRPYEVGTQLRLKRYKDYYLIIKN